jgi:GNAT superfamily N-acetyltransferase
MEKLTISALQPAEVGLIAELQPPEWPSILPAIEFYTKTDYCYPLKVTLDGKIVGTGTAIQNDGTAWLAHIVTHPDHRNRGIGKFITQALVDDLTAKKFTERSALKPRQHTCFSKRCAAMMHLKCQQQSCPILREQGRRSQRWITGYRVSDGSSN